MEIMRYKKWKQLKFVAVAFCLLFFPFSQNAVAQNVANESCLSIPQDVKSFFGNNDCITKTTSCSQFAEEHTKQSYDPQRSVLEASCERVKLGETDTVCLNAEDFLNISPVHYPFQCLKYETDCLVYQGATTDRSSCVAHFAVAKGDINSCKELYSYNPYYCKVAYAVISRNRNICGQIGGDKGYCNKQITEFETRQCLKIADSKTVKDCLVNLAIENNDTWSCRELPSEDRQTCILKVSSSNRDASHCDKLYDDSRYGCTDNICRNLSSEGEIASCYFSVLGTAPDLKLCGALTDEHKQNDCYNNFASFSSVASHYNASDFERRKACSLIGDFREEQLCKFYSGIFPERTVFHILFGLSAVFGLFCFLIRSYKKRFGRVSSKLLLTVSSILLSIIPFFFSKILLIPFIGMFFDHTWMIGKILCPPDGSGGCSSGGWLSFPTGKGIFAMIIIPILYVIIAFLALSFCKRLANKEREETHT